MRKTLIALTIAVVTLAATACSVRTDLPPNAPQLIDNGKNVYLEYCAECHQTDGSGWSHLYPRLAGNPIVTLHDPSPIITTVVYGLGSMPSFSTRLTTDDIASVLSYIRNAWGNNAEAVSPRLIH